MKAIVFKAYGGPEVLELADVPAPHPAPGQIRIAVRAAGVNLLDRKLREGTLRDVRPLRLPSGTGGDAAGDVDELGEGVTGVRIGDAVFGSGDATYAQYAVLTSWAPKPPQASYAEAAGWPTPFETALRLLDDAGVHRGQTVLVNGAGGGVGSAAVQFAVERGATVIGVAGPGGQDYVASLGALAVPYGEGLAERVRALGAGPVDAALDVAGSGVIPELIAMTGDPSRVISIADFGAPAYGARVSAGFGRDRTPALREGARLVAAGRLRIPVAQRFPLDRAAAAQEASASGRTRGRIVIDVSIDPAGAS